MNKTGTDNGYGSFLANIRIPIWLTIAAVITFILIMAFTVNHVRERDIVEQFSRQQTAIARGTAAGIEDLISSVEKSMIILSRLPCVTGVMPETTRQSIKVIYDNLDGKVEFIAVKNIDGVVTAKYPPSIFEEMTDESFESSSYFQEIKKTGRTYIGDLQLGREGEAKNRVQSVVVAVPKYDADDNFSGAVFTGLSLSAIIYRYIKATSETSGCGWIIDSSGATLVHPDEAHACMEPETLGNAKTVDGASLRDVLAEGKEGYSECMLPVEGGKTKKSIIAYAPVNAGSGRWFVAITTPYNKIVLLARKGFINIIFWTLGFIIVVIITGISVAYLGVRRLHLEEELKRLKETKVWQEKLLREYSTTEGIIEGSPIPSFVLNREHRVILWNKACSELTGFQAEDMIGTDNHSIPFYKKKRPALADIILDYDINVLKKYYSTKSIKESVTVKGAYEFMDYFPDVGGKNRYLYFLAAPIYDGKGEIIASIVTIQDVTQAKQLQHESESHIHQLSTLWSISSALSASLDIEERSRIAVDKIIASLDVDSAGIYLKEEKSNFCVAYSFGYSESFYQTGSTVGPDGIVGEAAREGKTIILEDVTIANTPYIEFTLNEGLKSAAYFPLVSSEEIFGVVRVSSHTSRRFSDEDKSLLELICNHVALAIENARLHYQAKMSSRSLELKVKEKTKELEESYRELRRSEERYRTMFDADPNPIFIMDIKTLKILDINATALDCYGYSRDEFLEMSFSDLGYDKDPELSEELKNFSLDHSNFYPKRIHQRKGGNYFYVNVHISPVRFMEKDSLIATTTDITENVEKESQLIQAGKMATLGTMAAGMAHEINQPLNVIQVCADFFLKTLKKDKEISRLELTTMADEIGSNVQRAAGIINHMRDFARQSEAVSGELNINEPIRDVFKVLGQQLRVHQIDLELDLDDKLPPILADHNRMEQVFINLVTNAMDTLDEKDKSEDQEWKKILKIRSFSKDGQVVVAVFDNGMGISEEIIDKIFEPFFTTKDIGKGTGLGMSISYGIVKDYGGTINVRSKSGEGTTFELRFPIIT